MELSYDTSSDLPYLREIAAFLIASVIIVPLFHRIRASPILGYLATGAIIGPFGLQLVADVDGVRALAELGIVFLMFTIGLELSIQRLRDMRRMVFGLGGAQVILSATVIAAIAAAWGNGTHASIILGLALALSSTAVIFQLLCERGEFATPLGRNAFAVLLLQDLAVVPLLALVEIFATGQSDALLSDLAIALTKAAIAVIAIMTVGRLIMRLAYPVIAATRSPELFVALTLLAVLGTAYITGISGLSAAMGAFLAGLLLAETEFRHQIESDILPFRGLLLGLFFISIGMSINFAGILTQWPMILLSIAGLIFIKAAILFALCRAFAVPVHTAIRVALLLSAGGEFAFVAIAASLHGGLLQQDVGQFMFLVTALSLALTPLLALAGNAVARYISDRNISPVAIPDSPGEPPDEPHVVIAGYGRVGRTIARLLADQEIPFIAIDNDAHRTQAARRDAIPIHYGDASRADVLDRAGAGNAALVAVTMDDHQAVSRAIAAIRRRWPNVPIHARARDVRHSAELARIGVHDAVPETLEASLHLAGQILRSLGTPLEAVNTVLDRVRDADASPSDAATGA